MSRSAHPIAPATPRSNSSSCPPGVRIKTVYDATGSVSDVTYKDITLSGITKYGIVIEQVGSSLDLL